MTDDPPPDPAARPAWARFLGDGEWESFVAAVEDELRRRRWRYRLADGYVWAPWGADEADGDADEALSLLNLAQLCHAAAPEDRPQVIAGHFDALVAGHDDRVLADALAGDLAAARPYLKVRLYPKATFEADADQFVVRDVADGLCAVLCFDLPSNVVTVNAESLQRWGCTADDAWYQALANLRRTERAEVSPVEVEGATLAAMSGDSFFVASNLLLLGDFLEEESRWGALAVAPNRHTLLFHPITDLAVLRAIDALVVMAARLCAEGPGSISPHLYWWRDGVLKTLPAVETEDHFEFVPPEEFVTEVLEPLSARSTLN